MAPVGRDDVIWYYRLGGQSLGPVAWTAIEELTTDTIDARDLLVARGGDTTWISAAEAVATFPELAAPPPPAREPAPEDAGWIVDEAQAARPAAPPPLTVHAPRPMPSAGRVPEPGLGKWIGQAWEMVIEDVWPWVGAMLLMFLISGVSFGICGPPLTIGMYMMALKRFDGRTLGAGDVFDGFSRFWSAWGAHLLMLLPMLVLAIPVMAIIFGGVLATERSDEFAPFMILGIYALYPIIYLAMLFVQTVFFYAWVLVAEGEGAWEAVVASWDKVKLQFWSYLGIYIVLTLLASIGSYACYVGLFVTWPLLPCATAAAYRWHFRREAR